jgi:hypothetical protein
VVHNGFGAAIVHTYDVKQLKRVGHTQMIRIQCMLTPKFQSAHTRSR